MCTVYWHHASSNKGDAIPKSVERAVRFAEGMSFEDLRRDGNTVSAVVRNTGVTGEPASHVPEGIHELYPGISWLRMRNTRNVVIHEHADQPPLVCQTAKSNLPPLVSMFREILEKKRNPRVYYAPNRRSVASTEPT